MTYGLLLIATWNLSTDPATHGQTLAELLTSVADSQDIGSPIEPDARHANAREAARHVLACADLPDPDQDDPLQAIAPLDQLPRDDRLRILRAATEHSWLPYPTTRPRRRTVSGCPCPCNSGGFCGGCGHAGCGGR